MAVGRVSSYVMQQITLKNAAGVQSTLADLQTQLSSGMKSQTFAGLGSQSEQFLALENKLARTKVFDENNKVAESRLNTTATAIDQIITTATDAKNLVLLRRNQSSAASLPFAQQIESYYKTIAGQLNTNSEGRYLFSGSQTDTPPLDVSKFPELDAQNKLKPGFYKGSQQNILTKVDESIDMTLNVRADAPGFQKILQGLALAKQGDASKNDAELAQAYDLINAGVKEVTDSQAAVNANKVILKEIGDRLTSMQLYWKSLKEEIGNTDMLAATTLVSINQGVLQASFSAFSKINNLKLSDFLR